ncbi:MAG: tetratricopeptide repeat protein [Alphaproteobacteria bacterium]|nr:tetratricopeptide repeat protein [Alphaproteobacteria bacterium]
MAQTAFLLQTAIAHHKAQRFEEAEQAYRKFLRAGSTNPDALRLLGTLYLQMGKITQAASFLEKAARIRPKDPEILTNLGVALRGLNQTEAALKRFNQALTLDPDYAPALHNIAAIYAAQGQMDKAAQRYSRLIDLFPRNSPLYVDCANCLFALGKIDQAIAFYEKALALDPHNSPAMVNLGMALSYIGKTEASKPWLQRARTLFEKALETTPDNPVILNNLGNVLRQQGQPEEAASCFRRALQARPDYAHALINMASTLRDLNRIDDAINSCQTALALAPNSAEARINLGTFLQQKGEHRDAVTLFSEALEINPSSIDALWNKSLSLLALGQYKEGWTLHEIGLGFPHMRGPYSSSKRWEGEPLDGQRLLITSEQGFGDTLQFIRYAQKIKKMGASVHVLCPKPLQRLLANCPFIDILPETMDDSSFDYHIPVMSLPYAFETTLETIPAQTPYLYVSDETQRAWNARFLKNSAFRVGLVWAGNPRTTNATAHLIDARRSLPWAMASALLDVDGTVFYSLQKDGPRPPPDTDIVDWMDDVQDFEDTAAIIQNLDLVLSVDTAVAHLAGGLNKPVWILSRADACWRWLQNKPQSPWYPSARIFGQPRAGDWASVLATVRIALKQKVSEHYLASVSQTEAFAR